MQHMGAMRAALAAAEARMAELESELADAQHTLVRREQDNAVLVDEVSRARAVRPHPTQLPRSRSHLTLLLMSGEGRGAADVPGCGGD
jgi:hypothetical protein